jgi:hypothetical protein
MKKDIIIHKIKNMLCDNIAGILRKKGQLKNDDEQFGSLITLIYLRGKIESLLDKIVEKNR